MILKKIKHFLQKQQKKTEQTVHATVIPRAKHSISRQNIDPHALKVLYRLSNAGYDAYLVGGCIRDLLLDKHPKDFDVATNATPEQVRSLFRNCRLIGRRFRLAHVFFYEHIIEVATFRGHHDESSNTSHSETGMILRDNQYGSIEEDAVRRDFTINALYYDIRDFSVVDFTDAMKDIQREQIVMIGDPDTRFREDPVRMLRAVRFAAKLDFSIEPNTLASMGELHSLLENINNSRLFEEFIKLFHSGQAIRTFYLLQKHHMLTYISQPAVEALEENEQAEDFFQAALNNTDDRIANGKHTTPTFLMTVFLWPHILKMLTRHEQKEMPRYEALQLAISDALTAQRRQTMLPRKLVNGIQDIAHLQYHLERRRGRAPYRTLSHPRFRAGYDFLLLRAQIDADLQPLADWWTTFQTASHDARQQLIDELPPTPKRQ